MAGIDTRSDSRDSFFLLANICVDGAREPSRVRVRNLSNGGMMGEGDALVRRGDCVTVELGSVGAIPATIAWVQGRRFGVAFDREIDAERARRPVATASDRPYGDGAFSRAHRAPAPPAPPERLRRI